jgi:hypothetical protein
MTFHRDVVGRISVDAWARHALVSQELIEIADPAFLRYDETGGVLTIVVANGMATYRVGAPQKRGVGGYELPIWLEVTSGNAPVAEA